MASRIADANVDCLIASQRPSISAVTPVVHSAMSFDGVGAPVTTLKFVQYRAQCGTTETDLPDDGRQVDWVVWHLGAS